MLLAMKIIFGALGVLLVLAIAWLVIMAYAMSDSQ